MEGLESTWALTKALIKLTGGEGGEDSCGLLGLEGKRPLRPFKLAVLTTVKKQNTVCNFNDCYARVMFFFFSENKYLFSVAYIFWMRIMIMYSMNSLKDASISSLCLGKYKEISYLLSPSRLLGTSEIGSTDICFFDVYPQDSFYWLSKHIWRSSVLCAKVGRHKIFRLYKIKFMKR